MGRCLEGISDCFGEMLSEDEGEALDNDFDTAEVDTVVFTTVVMAV